MIEKNITLRDTHVKIPNTGAGSHTGRKSLTLAAPFPPPSFMSHSFGFSKLGQSSKTPNGQTHACTQAKTAPTDTLQQFRVSGAILNWEVSVVGQNQHFLANQLFPEMFLSARHTSVWGQLIDLANKVQLQRELIFRHKCHLKQFPLWWTHNPNFSLWASFIYETLVPLSIWKSVCQCRSKTTTKRTRPSFACSCQGNLTQDDLLT